MNTFSTPPRSGLHYLEQDPDTGEVRDPGQAGNTDPGEEPDAEHGRYATLPGRDPIDLEALSDLSLD